MKRDDRTMMAIAVAGLALGIIAVFYAHQNYLDVNELLRLLRHLAQTRS